MAEGRRRRQRLRNPSHSLNLDGFKEVAAIPGGTAEVGRGEHQLEFKRITDNIGYTVHSMHAIGTWCFQGSHRFRSGERESRFEYYYQQQQYQNQEGNCDR